MQLSVAGNFVVGLDLDRQTKMTRITQIEDKSAATAWSPIQSCSDVIAIGTKVCFDCFALQMTQPAKRRKDCLQLT